MQNNIPTDEYSTYFSGRLYKNVVSANSWVSQRHFAVNLTGINLKGIDAYAVLE